MNRGFALIAVLWVTVALAGLALVAASNEDVAVASATSRIRFVRGRWAAASCLAVAQSALDDAARTGRPITGVPGDTLDMADGSRCTAELSDSTVAATIPRIHVSVFGWIPGEPGGARLDVLFVGAGDRAAPVRQELR